VPVNGRAARPYSLNWGEQDSLIKALPRHLLDMTLFQVNTGCREQEVCRLRWDWKIRVPELNTSAFIIPAYTTELGGGAGGTADVDGKGNRSRIGSDTDSAETACCRINIG